MSEDTSFHRWRTTVESAHARARSIGEEMEGLLSRPIGPDTRKEVSRLFSRAERELVIQNFFRSKLEHLVWMLDNKPLEWPGGSGTARPNPLPQGAASGIPS